MIEFIGGADMCDTPYLNPAQITSGTLAYTVGAGKAVISTPYWYAEELLAEGRGLLVPFAGAAPIADRAAEVSANQPDAPATPTRAYIVARHRIATLCPL